MLRDRVGVSRMGIAAELHQIYERHHTVERLKFIYQFLLICHLSIVERYILTRILLIRVRSKHFRSVENCVFSNLLLAISERANESAFLAIVLLRFCWFNISYNIIQPSIANFCVISQSRVIAKLKSDWVTLFSHAY